MPTKHLKPNLALYLVTDSGLLAKGKDFVEHIKDAVRGGVTIVQLREKQLETRAFIELGMRVHRITKAAGIPLLINDRIDVALAVGCEGVHIGWKDCGTVQSISVAG